MYAIRSYYDIDAGDSVTFYYRVDPNELTAPQQRLVETAFATYDSMEGAVITSYSIHYTKLYDPGRRVALGVC